jgi:hypothetical protein
MLSLLGTVASTFMQNSAQKKSMGDYNNQVRKQNKLLQDQFTDRQKKINEARTQQGRTFQEMASAQDAEFAKQKDLARQKQQVLEQAVQQPTNQGMKAPEFDQAVDRRNQLFRDTAGAPTADFNPTGPAAPDTAENRILRSAQEKASLRENDKTAGMVDALSRMGALGDQQQRQQALFRDMNVGMSDVAQDAQAGSRALDFKLRTPGYRMGALSNVMGEQASMPYYRGQEPTYRQPNTLFADILGGASQLAGMYGFYQKPPGGVGADVDRLIAQNPGGIFR